MTTTTTNYGWIKPDVGASTDAWGGILNSDLDGIDSTVKSVSDAAYPASNPSGYQTAAQVTASLGGYLPLAGGTLTGPVTFPGVPGTGIKINGAAGTERAIGGYTSGSLRWYIDLGTNAAEGGSDAGSDFSVNSCHDNGAYFSTVLSIARSNAAVTWGGTGNFNVGGPVYSGLGYSCKAGNAGARGANVFNLYWTGSATALWIDAVNNGNITVSSDYRIKKDVADLPSMWERAKALRPISYTHQDYTPPNLPAKEDGSAADPHIVGDDIERWGFIAHELQETLIQDAATGEKDSPIHIQSPNVMTVIATLTKALQEAMTRIEALEAKAA